MRSSYLSVELKYSQRILDKGITIDSDLFKLAGEITAD